jgi:hypothetical protein
MSKRNNMPKRDNIIEENILKKKLKNWEIYVYEKKLQLENNDYWKSLFWYIYLQIEGIWFLEVNGIDKVINPDPSVFCFGRDFIELEIRLYYYIKEFFIWEHNNFNILKYNETNKLIIGINWDTLWDLSLLFLEDVRECIWYFFDTLFQKDLSPTEIEVFLHFLLFYFLLTFFEVCHEINDFRKYCEYRREYRKWEFNEWLKEDSIFNDIEHYKKYRKIYLMSELNKTGISYQDPVTMSNILWLCQMCFYNLRK